METLIQLLINLAVPIFLILLGLVVGKTVEQLHFRNLSIREKKLRDILVTDIKSFPLQDPSHPGSELVTGQVVIATDYLKTFLAALKKIVGGEVRSYETLLLRARREALVRMLEEAQRLGYNAVCNIRLDTADIGGSTTNKRNKATTVGVLATGTAYHRALPSD